MKLVFFTFIVSGLMLLGSSGSFAFVESKYTCGLTGSIKDRIRDCSKQEYSSRGIFILVTRTIFDNEVYKDPKTGLLWGDRLSSHSSSMAHFSTYMDHYDAEKACNASLDEVGKIAGVTWRLPSIAEYKKASHNEIQYVLPNMDGTFWSSSVRRSHMSNDAWQFNGYNGDTYYYDRTGGASVRCVAR